MGIAGKLFIALTCICFCSAMNAQNDITAAGGDASSVWGSTNFSIGQIAYTGGESSTGSINQGVQQPFEFFITGISENLVDPIQIEVFPNPTQSVVQLKITNLPSDPLQLEIFSIEGKCIRRQAITSTSVQIPLQEIAASTYLLRISNSTTLIKSFKLVKIK